MREIYEKFEFLGLNMLNLVANAHKSHNSTLNLGDLNLQGF